MRVQPVEIEINAALPDRNRLAHALNGDTATCGLLVMKVVFSLLALIRVLISCFLGRIMSSLTVPSSKP